MKAVRFHRPGGPDVLVHEEVETLRAGPGEVLIKVEAAGVNYADTMRRYNDPYPEPSDPPFTLGVEVAGTVAELGKGVSGPPVGTPVFAAPGKGGYAQFAIVPAPLIIPIPPTLDKVQATALVLQGLTASLTLKQAGRLRPGESVLVQAAAGGVGVLAIQLAKHFGAGQVIAAASTPEKRELAMSLGADLAVDYTDPSWVERVREATDGKGADIILDMAGGAISEQSLSALAPFGRLVVYGLASRTSVSINPQQLLVPNQSVVGFYVGSYFGQPELIQQTLGEVIGLVASGQVKLHIGQVLPLSQASEAHRLIEARQTTGKVVLLPWSDGHAA